MTSTVTAPAPARGGMRGLSTLVRSEARLFLRYPGNVFFVVAFPSVLLLGMGFIVPGMREPLTDVPAPWLGLRVIDMFLPIILCVSAATAGLTSLPLILAGYRETGVLRRLSTTPMRPQGVLLAQVVVQLCGVVAGSVIALLAALLAVGTPGPELPLVAVAAFPLSVTAMFSIGLVIGGLAPRASSASGIGMLLYFPMLFFAGLWTPGPLMPGTLQTISSYTPLGAASQAMTAAWFEGSVPWLQLGVMAAWSVVLFGVATKTFRWSR